MHVVADAWSAFIQSLIEGGAQPAAGVPTPRVARFGDVEAEHRALGEGCALVDCCCRALLEITGADRASWLHNLTSNQVKPLSVGDGNYAFCLNSKGRILFDLNILVGEESIRVDIDESFRAFAVAHFEKYTITEDVTVVDRSDDFVRIGLVGNCVADVLNRLTATNAANLPLLGSMSITWNGDTIRMVRTDFCGPFSVEFFAPPQQAVEFRRWLAGLDGVLPVGDDAMEIRRIEAGIPWPGREITDEYLPAETGQFARAVSSNKGCYLGQEIVERMRSRGVVARRLVGLDIDGDVLPPPGTALEDSSGTSVGTVTSVCRSVQRNRIIGLGYVRSDSSEEGRRLELACEGQATGAMVVALPFAG